MAARGSNDEYVGSSDEDDELGVAVVLDLRQRGWRGPLELPSLHPPLPFGLNHHRRLPPLLLMAGDCSVARDEG